MCHRAASGGWSLGSRAVVASTSPPPPSKPEGERARQPSGAQAAAAGASTADGITRCSRSRRCRLEARRRRRRRSCLRTGRSRTYRPRVPSRSGAARRRRGRSGSGCTSWTHGGEGRLRDRPRFYHRWDAPIAAPTGSATDPLVLGNTSAGRPPLCFTPSAPVRAAAPHIPETCARSASGPGSPRGGATSRAPPHG